MWVDEVEGNEVGKAKRGLKLTFFLSGVRGEPHASGHLIFRFFIVVANALGLWRTPWTLLQYFGCSFRLLISFGACIMVNGAEMFEKKNEKSMLESKYLIEMHKE